MIVTQQDSGAYLRHGFGYENILLVAQTETTIPVIAPYVDDTRKELQH